MNNQNEEQLETNGAQEQTATAAKPRVPKTYEEEILLQLYKLKDHADDLENLITELQKIFIVKYDKDNNALVVEIAPDALSPDDPEVTKYHMNLLFSLFGRRTETTVVTEEVASEVSDDTK